MTKDIIASIREYAIAYDRFQRFQNAHPDQLPLGDQKTGVIGEFYAMLYARFVYPGCAFIFAGSNEAWDIEVSGERDQSHGPIRNFEKREDLRRDLHEQPTDDCVRNRDL